MQYIRILYYQTRTLVCRYSMEIYQSIDCYYFVQALVTVGLTSLPADMDIPALVQRLETVGVAVETLSFKLPCFVVLDCFVLLHGPPDLHSMHIYWTFLLKNNFDIIRTYNFFAIHCIFLFKDQFNFSRGRAMRFRLSFFSTKEFTTPFNALKAVSKMASNSSLF